MVDASHLSRRRVLQGGIALGALGAAGLPAASAYAAPAAAPRLPARGNIVIRNAYVMTMEPATPDISDGDVHVKDGVIVAVGQKLSAPGATTINGAGMIVLPGLVETHWHMWNTLLRSMSGEKTEFGYFRTTAALGQKYEPADMYLGTGSRRLRRSTTASPSSMIGATTSVHPPMSSRICGRCGIRAARSLLLWRCAGDAEQPGHRARRFGAAGARLAELFQRRSDHAGLAWRGMGATTPPPQSRRRSTRRRSKPPASWVCRFRSTRAARARPLVRSPPLRKPAFSPRTCRLFTGSY